DREQSSRERTRCEWPVQATGESFRNFKRSLAADSLQNAAMIKYGTPLVAVDDRDRSTPTCMLRTPARRIPFAGPLPTTPEGPKKSNQGRNCCPSRWCHRLHKIPRTFPMLLGSAKRKSSITQTVFGAAL